MTVFDADCRRCPRLVDCREASARRFPGYHGAPVAAFGDPAPEWLIVGLAPGLHGANRTGRPFTGDHAGILLYETLHALGASTAAVSEHPDDGLQLKGVRVTNAVKCLPPANKPLPAEIRACNGYLAAELETLAPRVVVALGRIAHDAVLDAVGRPVRAVASVTVPSIRSSLRDRRSRRSRWWIRTTAAGTTPRPGV